MNKILKSIFATVVVLLATLNSSAQTDKAIAANMIASKQFTFIATSATPMNTQDISKIMGKMQGGAQSSLINLSGDGYDVKITADSVVAYLPYYGRSYSAPMNPSDGGIKFTSKKFDYKTKKGKKGNWSVDLIIKDRNENYRLNFMISENGNGSLTINSNSKQSISYQGYLSENMKKQN